MEKVKEPAEEVAPQKGDQREKQADFGRLRAADAKAPEGQEPEVRRGGQEVAHAYIGEGFKGASAAGLAAGELAGERWRGRAGPSEAGGREAAHVPKSQLPRRARRAR